MLPAGASRTLSTSTTAATTILNNAKKKPQPEM
jgi:hypothetical protein